MKNKLKEIKKILMSGAGIIRISSHTKRRMDQRGYSKADLVAAIMNGQIVEVQYERQTFNYIIQGKDQDHNPIVVVIAENKYLDYSIVTVMPPIDRSRFSECI
jgi:hypothetical protein